MADEKPLPDEIDDELDDDRDDDDTGDDDEDEEGEGEDEPSQWDILDALDELVEALDSHRKVVRANTKAIERVEKVLKGVNIGKELMEKIPSLLDFLSRLRRREK